MSICFVTAGDGQGHGLPPLSATERPCGALVQHMPMRYFELTGRAATIVLLHSLEHVPLILNHLFGVMAGLVPAIHVF